MRENLLNGTPSVDGTIFRIPSGHRSGYLYLNFYLKDSGRVSIHLPEPSSIGTLLTSESVLELTSGTFLDTVLLCRFDED